jgi:two-component system sensor histidine kinase/response regulator
MLKNIQRHSMRNPPEILIIDDDQDNISLLSWVLKNSGYHVTCCDNGTDGYEMALSHLPDLILLDVTMSGKNGYEVCQCLRENNLTSCIPIIFVTARDSIGDKIKGLDTGGVDYITKPFQNSEILARVHTHLKLKSIYEENLEYNKELMRSQKMASITTLAGGIAHNINNLIGTVIGYADMLQESLDTNTKAHRYSRRILESAQRVSDLTKNLLNYARAGREAESRIDINTLLGKMVNLYKNKNQDKIQVKLNLANETLEIHGDQDRILQALANIFINAQEATPNNGIITIKTEKGHLPEKYECGEPDKNYKDYIVISISDTGPGINKDEVSMIFEPFFTTKQAVGAGLGLSAASGVIQKHKGAISVNTKPGEGSIFNVYLPMNQGD